MGTEKRVRQAASSSAKAPGKSACGEAGPDGGIVGLPSRQEREGHSRKGRRRNKGMLSGRPLKDSKHFEEAGSLKEPDLTSYKDRK